MKKGLNSAGTGVAEVGTSRAVEVVSIDRGATRALLIAVGLHSDPPAGYVCQGHPLPPLEGVKVGDPGTVTLLDDGTWMFAKGTVGSPPPPHPGHYDQEPPPQPGLIEK